jgi:hypothetical protein
VLQKEAMEKLEKDGFDIGKMILARGEEKELEKSHR